jgi:RHS repeat-associated protein
MATTLGALNPLRYRGYVYDTETGFYYLQSRYYDPQIGRFLNADAFTSTGQGLLGNNMFAYCYNNSVCMADYQGQDAIYVVDTSPDDGIPVVGHAILYIQDEEDNWFMTDYSGVFPDKKTARIRYIPVSEEEINRILDGNNGEYIQYAYISGDFTKSADAAKVYSGTDYSGYNLAFNNCMHYAQQMLLKGTFDNYLEYMAVNCYAGPVPQNLMKSITGAQIISKTWRGVVDGAKKIWECMVDFFG